MTSTVSRTGIAPRDNGAPPPDIPLDDIDLGTIEFWEWDDDRRDGAFATLRRESPVTFFETPEMAGFPTGAGHWALTRHDDVHYASRHPELFSSSPTSTSLNDVPVEVAEFFGSMITLDDPRHLRLRGIVNRAFTPKVLKRIEESVAQRARAVVTDFVEAHANGNGDFVAEVAAPLPLQIICDMMGIPHEDEQKVFHWTSVIMGAVVGIALLVGGIGIMNIMLVSVTERTREIGVRKSIGARRRDVLVQFLIEAISLSALGGLIGVAGGWLLATTAQLILNHSFPSLNLPPAHTPLWAIVLAFGFCAILGVVFGLYPAAKASKLDPIEALRYE